MTCMDLDKQLAVFLLAEKEYFGSCVEEWRLPTTRSG